MDKKDELVTLGLKIRQFRKKAGYSQESFASEIGMARSFLGCIERGEKNVTALNLIKIARALNIKVGDMFSDIK